ncbi:MAG: hypothetical protein VYE68_09825 [Acidobacteriota bacterium]|nr:hypothetical protein [Acidobacteriota bacterium]
MTRTRPLYRSRPALGGRIRNTMTIISLGGRWGCGADPRTPRRTDVQRGLDGGQSDSVLDLEGGTFAESVVFGRVRGCTLRCDDGRVI